MAGTGRQVDFGIDIIQIARAGSQVNLRFQYNMPFFTRIITRDSLHTIKRV